MKLLDTRDVCCWIRELGLPLEVFLRHRGMLWLSPLHVARPLQSHMVTVTGNRTQIPSHHLTMAMLTTSTHPLIHSIQYIAHGQKLHFGI